jgi:hypothetical protein
LSSPHLEASPATTFRACSSPAPTPVKPQPAPTILSQESIHTTLSITHHTRKRPSTDPRTTHGPHSAARAAAGEPTGGLLGRPPPPALACAPSRGRPLPYIARGRGRVCLALLTLRLHPRLTSLYSAATGVARRCRSARQFVG